jgi:hypothetical protein
MKGGENLLQIIFIDQHNDPADRIAIFDFSELMAGFVTVLRRIHDEDAYTTLGHWKRADILQT